MEIPGPLSKSSIGDFETCPWLYYAYRILKRKREIGLPAMNGIEAHDLIRQFITEDLHFQNILNKATNDDVRNIIELTNTWWPLRELREKFQTRSLMVEEQIFATRTGKRVKTRRSALVTGIVDLAEVRDGVLYVDDWKSGNWEKDNQLERDLYAGVIGRAIDPKIKKIVFTLRWMKSGRTYQSVYRFSSTDKTVVVTDPSNTETVRTCKDMNPFLWDIKQTAEAIRTAKPTPKHGPHCKKMFGKPCQFYADASCPYWVEKLKEE